MSRIASVKETGEELTPAEWERFEKAVTVEIRERPASEPYERGAEAKEPREQKAGSRDTVKPRA